MKSATIRAQVIALHRVDIASPCTASWAAMEGDDRVRHCGDCKKDVFNLSALPEEEAAALLANNDGNLCVRFYRRRDGTVMTSDCSTSVRAWSRRAIGKVPHAAGAALLAMSVGAGAAAESPPAPASRAFADYDPARMTMGAPPAPVLPKEAVIELQGKPQVVLQGRVATRQPPAEVNKKLK